MIGHAELHRWRDSKRLVNATEIILRDVQRNSRTMAFKLFAEAICQPREAALLHSQS